MFSGGFVHQPNQLVHPSMHFSTTNITMLAMQWGGSPRWEGKRGLLSPVGVPVDDDDNDCRTRLTASSGSL
jgi:hypothetical protein